ncbi:AAA family ATPase [Salinicola endophyticus]|uniref:AAA family ATPase n=1 Tax=Salinicola endophyticus TaxID=1949083 RepID=A0AB74UG08_9GAMM
MKVVIENYGPVHKFEFDTESSFHLIVGTNNVGKSYALSAFYSVLKAVHELSSLRNFYILLEDDLAAKEYPSDEDFPTIDMGKQEVKVNASYRMIAKELFDSTLGAYLSDAIKASYSELSSISNRFSGEKAKITVGLDFFSVILEGDVDGFEVIDVQFSEDFYLRAVKQNRTTVAQENKIIIYRNTKVEKTEKQAVNILRQDCIHRVIKCYRDVSYRINDVHYLPASRSGLYLSLQAFGQIIAQLSQSRSLLSKKIEIPGISQQLSDYFIKLSNINTSNAKSSSEIEEVAKKIERDVLKGTIEFDENEKRLYYQPLNTDLRLDLAGTSSMVSEVAPIVAYIRHILTQVSPAIPARRFRNNLKKYGLFRQVLIIEEPEAHLHPENQIKMTEIYAQLAGLGVSVVMTSHSNYVFNKLSNIMIKKELLPQNVRCDLFAMTDKGGVGFRQEIDEYGIDDNNFIDASQRLLEEKMDLIDSLDDDL